MSQVIIFPNDFSWYSYYSSFPNTPIWQFVYLRDNMLSTLEGIEILTRVKVLFSLLIDFCPFIVLRIVKPAGFEPLEMADNWLKFFSRFLIWVSMTLKGQDLNLLRIAKPCRFVLWSFLSSVMSLPWNKFLNIYQFCSNCILLETKLHLLEASQSFPIWR